MGGWGGGVELCIPKVLGYNFVLRVIIIKSIINVALQCGKSHLRDFALGLHLLQTVAPSLSQPHYLPEEHNKPLA